MVISVPLFMLFTYYISGRINKLINKDLIESLKDMNYEMNFGYEDDYKYILDEYVTAYPVGRVFKVLSVLPCVNVFYAVTNVFVYNEQKDTIINELNETNAISNIESLDAVKVIDESLDKIDGILNKYPNNDTKQKIKQKRKEH